MWIAELTAFLFIHSILIMEHPKPILSLVKTL